MLFCTDKTVCCMPPSCVTRALTLAVSKKKQILISTSTHCVPRAVRLLTSVQWPPSLQAVLPLPLRHLVATSAVSCTMFACGTQLTLLAHDDDEPDLPAPASRKRAAAATQPCCRCLRRLTTAGGAAGTMVVCDMLTPTGKVAIRCKYCSRGKRGGEKGCVPVCRMFLACGFHANCV